MTSISILSTRKNAIRLIKEKRKKVEKRKKIDNKTTMCALKLSKLIKTNQNKLN